MSEREKGWRVSRREKDVEKMKANKHEMMMAAVYDVSELALNLIE